MNKTTEALKLAEGALLRSNGALGEYTADTWRLTMQDNDEALAAIREVLAEPDIEEMTLTQIASRHEPVKQEPVAWRYNSNGDWIYKDRKVWDAAEPLYAAPAQPVKQEPVVCQDSDDRRLLREIFMLCEATEEIEATNDFMRGRVFEAKGIRRGIGTWYQDTFCGRSYMGEPVIPAAPVQPVKQEPVAYMVKSEGFIYSLVNRISAAEEIVSMLRKDDQGAAIHPLYAAPVQQVDLTDEELEALYDRHAGGWRVLFRAVIAAYKEKNK